MTDWSGRDYAEISDLQRAMIIDAMADLTFDPSDRVLDIGCGDGYLTRMVAELVPDGCVIGADASPRMIRAAVADPGGPCFVVADARALPFRSGFDAAVSFNALHWVPEQSRALAQIAAVLAPGGRAVLQMVCSGAQESVESVAMRIARTPSWASWFEGFEAPFLHPDPAGYGELAASSGLTCEQVGVTDREWDFGSRSAFSRWFAVGSTAWTDRLPAAERDAFVADVVGAYEGVVGRGGLFRFTQMRVELRR